MEVGRAREEDAAAAAALWTEAYTDDPRGGRRTSYSPEDFRSTAEAGEVLVVRDGTSLAGVVAFYMADARRGMIASAEEAELSRLAVAERYRRRGIGRKLVERCLQLVADRHASALVLWSRPHQIEAHQLYILLGFDRAPGRDTEDAEGSRLVFVNRL